MNILYFGCLVHKGHFMHDRTDIYYGDRKWDKTPWGVHIDGGMLKGKPYDQGVIYFEQRDGWSAVAFCDYSIDSRPGSHSIFSCQCINN